MIRQRSNFLIDNNGKKESNPPGHGAPHAAQPREPSSAKPRVKAASKPSNKSSDKSSGKSADFKHVETWIFDLDNTLYPHHLNLWQQVDVRIRDYIVDFLKVTHEEAFRLQKDY